MGRTVVYTMIYVVFPSHSHCKLYQLCILVLYIDLFFVPDTGLVINVKLQLNLFDY